MSARKTKQKKKDALNRQNENTRRNKADQAAKRAAAQRAADLAEVERLTREATNSVKRAQAEKDFGKLVQTQPAHKRPIIEATAPPLLRLSTAKGKLVGQAGSQAPDLIGLGYYLTALYKSANNSQFASNGRVTADIAAVLSQIPDNQYAYISFRQVDSIDYTAPFAPDDGSIATLGIFDDHSVAVNRLCPYVDPSKLKVILVQGQAHLGLVMESVYSGSDAQQGLRPITPELERQLNDELDERRKAREAHDPQPAPTDPPTDPPSAELAPITGVPGPEAPMWHGLPPPLGAAPKVGVDGTLMPPPDWTVPQPNAPLVPRPQPATPPDAAPTVRQLRASAGPAAEPTVRQLRASAGPSEDHQALSASYRELIASVVAQGHHPPAIPPHPETGLPSVARALSTVEAKLRKAAKNDEEGRSEGLKTIAGLLASCDAEIRPRLHTRNWLVDDDAYVDLLCSGHWRAAGEHPQLGDIVWMAEPAIPGGGRVGIALEEDASQWLTTNFYGHLHITSRAPGAAVRAAWQPLDRDVFNPEQQIGAVWNAKRWRAMLADCYGAATATDKTIVGHIAQAAGVPGVTDPVELSGHLRGELWACRPGVPLWPGAIVFGREAGDVGVLLPDGDALGTSAVNSLSAQVLPMALQRFQPRFVWYPRPS